MLTFLIKNKDLQLLKVVCRCEIGTEGYNDTEKVEKSTCENAMKSSTIVLLKNVWFLVSYIRLTACVSLLLDTGDSVKLFRGKFRGQRVKHTVGLFGINFNVSLQCTFVSKVMALVLPRPRRNSGTQIIQGIVRLDESGTCWAVSPETPP